MKFIRSKIDYEKNEIIIYYKNKKNKIIEKRQPYNKLAPFSEEKKYDDYFNHIISSPDMISDSKIYEKLYKKKFKYNIQFDNLYLD